MSYSEVNGIQVRYLSLDELLRTRDFCFGGKKNHVRMLRLIDANWNLQRFWAFQRVRLVMRLRESEWIWMGSFWFHLIYNECALSVCRPICFVNDRLLTIAHKETSCSRNTDADLCNLISWLRTDLIFFFYFIQKLQMFEYFYDCTLHDLNMGTDINQKWMRLRSTDCLLLKTGQNF